MTQIFSSRFGRPLSIFSIFSRWYQKSVKESFSIGVHFFRSMTSSCSWLITIWVYFLFCTFFSLQYSLIFYAFEKLFLVQSFYLNTTLVPTFSKCSFWSLYSQLQIISSLYFQNVHFDLEHLKNGSFFKVQGPN